MPEMTIARQLVIRGRVQGVSYRAGAVAEADRLGLTGWVRNRRDGSVEAVVGGPEAAVADFIAWARRGPAGAVVGAVEVADVERPDGGPFGIRPTA